GPSDVVGATVADSFSSKLSGVTWTATGSAGTSFVASGSGDISATVSIPAGGSITYSVSATVNSSATGTLSNTATVTAPAGVTDAAGNNSATDTTTISLSSDLGVTKSDNKGGSS